MATEPRENTPLNCPPFQSWEDRLAWLRHVVSQLLTECFPITAKVEITTTPMEKWCLMEKIVNQHYYERHPPTIPDPNPPPPNPSPTEEPWDLEEDRQWY